MSCDIRPGAARPLTSRSFWVVMSLIWADLTLTFVGINRQLGEEANPFYALFTTQGLGAMVTGAVIYIVLVLLWFDRTPRWLRSITAGFLTTVHVYGVMSWIRNYIEIFDVFFGFFWLIVGPAFLGSVMTFWTYVNVRSCVDRDLIEWQETVND